MFDSLPKTVQIQSCDVEFFMDNQLPLQSQQLQPTQSQQEHPPFSAQPSTPPSLRPDMMRGTNLRRSRGHVLSDNPASQT
jgi:hypothetical protein